MSRQNCSTSLDLEPMRHGFDADLGEARLQHLGFEESAILQPGQAARSLATASSG